MANELRKKLAIVGMTGAVFAGGVFGLSGLASATTSDATETSTPDTTVAESQPAESMAVEPDEHELSDFDGFSAEDQELILKFETCIDDGFAQLPDEDEEWTAENDQQVDALFEECEVILDDLSFPAVDWLEGGDDWEEDWEEADWDEFYGELSAEDQAVFEKFDACIEDVEANLPENEADWTDEQFEQLESQFEACDPILDDLSEDADFFIIDGEGCEDLLYEGEILEEDEVLEDSAA